MNALGPITEYDINKSAPRPHISKYWRQNSPD